MDSNKIKVIFLDVDGVLNCKRTRSRTKSGYTFVDNSKLEMVKKIILVTGAKVVLSSDWRYDRDDDEYNQEFLELKERLESKGIFFYGFTPVINGGCHRGAEIQAWLDEHDEVGSFVILDDRQDMQPNMNKLCKTRMRDGLTEEITQCAINILIDGEV